MRKKVLAVVSALVITTLAFTGCGSNKSASSDNGSDSGAKSQAITVVSREEGSGTRGAFVELLGVVDENENDITVSSAQITNSTSVMLQKVAQTKSAIGYVSLGSLSTDVKAVQVDGVDATAENVKSGDYKVSRPFNICYKEDNLSINGATDVEPANVILPFCLLPVYFPSGVSPIYPSSFTIFCPSSLIT